MWPQHEHYLKTSLMKAEIAAVETEPSLQEEIILDLKFETPLYKESGFSP